jgi:hypothetical protein
MTTRIAKIAKQERACLVEMRRGGMARHSEDLNLQRLVFAHQVRHNLAGAAHVRGAATHSANGQ